MGLFSRTLSRLDELKRVLTKDPASRQFLALADEHRKRGEVAQAIAVLEKGLEQDPSSVAGHVALGRLLQQTGRGESALASFQAALRLDPQNLVALRQIADLHLAAGDKVEAVKKLKLFRGLSPGDREVNEIIRQLDEELSAVAAPRPPSRAPSGAAPLFPSPAAAYPPPVPPSPFATGEIPVAPAALPAGREARLVPETEAPVTVGGVEAASAAPGPAAMSAPAAGILEEALSPTHSGVEAAPEPPSLAVATPPHEPPVPEPFPANAATPAAPAVTETLAALLRAQGHLGEAEEAYRDLASRESNPARAARLEAAAAEIAAARVATPRGRLEAWVAPFARACDRRETDLVASVEDAVRRIGPSSAVVTDLEGVPVVSVGPLEDAEAMETLAAELTAFWKNARRSRAEIGEGALDGLVLSCSSGTAVVKVITPSYALLVKAAAGIPAGRLRFEAARAAEQLRPALV